MNWLAHTTNLIGQYLKIHMTIDMFVSVLDIIVIPDTFQQGWT